MRPPIVKFKFTYYVYYVTHHQMNGPSYRLLQAQLQCALVAGGARDAWYMEQPWGTVHPQIRQMIKSLGLTHVDTYQHLAMVVRPGFNSPLQTNANLGRVLGFTCSDAAFGGLQPEHMLHIYATNGAVRMHLRSEMCLKTEASRAQLVKIGTTSVAKFAPVLKPLGWTPKWYITSDDGLLVREKQMRRGDRLYIHQEKKEYLDDIDNYYEGAEAAFMADVIRDVVNAPSYALAYVQFLFRDIVTVRQRNALAQHGQH